MSPARKVTHLRGVNVDFEVLFVIRGGLDERAAGRAHLAHDGALARESHRFPHHGERLELVLDACRFDVEHTIHEPHHLAGTALREAREDDR
jgi:hypothetical protein